MPSANLMRLDRVEQVVPRPASIRYVRAGAGDPVGVDRLGGEEVPVRTGRPDADDRGGTVGDEQPLETPVAFLDQAVAAGQPGEPEG